jgi:hypothetical protein
MLLPGLNGSSTGPHFGAGAVTVFAVAMAAMMQLMILLILLPLPHHSAANAGKKI